MKIYYNDSMVSAGHDAPGPVKAASVLRHVIEAGLPVEVVGAFPSATRQQLELAHSPDYVDAVFQHGTGAFGAVDPTLHAQILAVNGAMCAAVCEVSQGGSEIVCVPASGFHHAGHDFGWGYCTFNGLVVAILNARQRTPWPQNVLIIDGDGHHGDGTDDIIEKLRIPGVTNLSGGALHGPRWEDRLAASLAADRPWDLVLYQAGADAHQDDPYGVGYLTDEDWYTRDLMVFRACLARRLSLVFNFAGGYNGAKTVDLHFRTVQLASKLLHGLRSTDGPATTILEPQC